MLKIVDLLFGIYSQHQKASTPWILNLAAHKYDPLLPGKILPAFGMHCHSALLDHIYFPGVAQVRREEQVETGGKSCSFPGSALGIFTLYHSEGSSFVLSRKVFSRPTVFWLGQLFSKASPQTSFSYLEGWFTSQNTIPTWWNTERIWDCKLNDLDFTLIQASAHEAGRLILAPESV